jgi:hypothetical protein
MPTVPVTVTLTVNLSDVFLPDIADSDGDLTNGLLMTVGDLLNHFEPNRFGNVTIDSLTIGTNNLTITAQQ